MATLGVYSYCDMISKDGGEGPEGLGGEGESKLRGSEVKLQSFVSYEVCCFKNKWRLTYYK